MCLNKMKKLLFLLVLSLLCAACSELSGALTDADVEKHLAAYAALEAASPELDKIETKEMKKWAIPACQPCLDHMEKVVQGVGYKDLKAFYAMELRMHVTMRAWAYASIGKLTGEFERNIAADLCSSKEEIARSQNPKEMALHCDRLKSYSGYLDKLGVVTVGAAEKLLREGDIAVVARHADAISAAAVTMRQSERDHYEHYH